MRHSGGSGKPFFILMTGRGSSEIGKQPLRTGKTWRVKRGFGGQTENIAGGLFAMYRCAMKPESSSDGMEPLSTSKIASGLTKPCGKARSGGDPSLRIRLPALR